MLYPPLTKFIDELITYAASSLESTVFGRAHVSAGIIEQLRGRLAARAEINSSFIARIHSINDGESDIFTPYFEHLTTDIRLECERFLCDLRRHITRYTYLCSHIKSHYDGILSVDLNISDRHIYGSAARIRTTSGFYISKHRQPDGERFLDGYAEILAGKGIEPAFKIPPYWSSPVGAIHLGINQSDEEVTIDDMIGVGNLLAQMYLIRATDLHSENIIRSASGVFYICDPETTMTPVAGETDRYTVFSTCIAPQTLVLDRSFSIEIGFISKLMNAMNHSDRDQISRCVSNQFRVMMRRLTSIGGELFIDICNLIENLDINFRVVLRPTQFYFNYMRLIHPARILSPHSLKQFRPLPSLENFPISTINEEMEALIDERVPVCHVQKNGSFYVDGKKVGVIRSPTDDLFAHFNHCYLHTDGISTSLKESLFPSALKYTYLQTIENRYDDILLQLRNAILEAFYREREGKWIATQPLPGDSYNINAYDFGLYNGWLGAAIFLAGMAKHFGAEVDGMASREIVRSAARFFEKDISLATGAAGLLYAQNIIRVIRGGEIDAGGSVSYTGVSDPLDFLSGLSGLVYTLNRISNNIDSFPGHIELIDHYRDALGRYFSPEHSYTSLAHGTSGIILALASGDCSAPSSVELLECLLDVEDRTKDLQGWLDLRKRPPRPIQKWCHGSVGVGISRLAILNAPKLRSKDLCVRARRDLELAVNSVVGYVSNQADYCCGNIGLADFLLEVGKFSGDLSLFRAAASKLECAVEQVCLGNPFHGSSPHLNIGLMKGYSGLGYVLLRLRNPDLPYLWAVKDAR